jgi:hypothetical protein
MPAEATMTRNDLRRPQATERDVVPQADVRRQLSRPGEHGAAVVVVPLGRFLPGKARELDPDRVRVAAARMPGDVLLANALHDDVGVDAVVGGHLGRATGEPLGTREGRAHALRRLHRVDHDDVDPASDDGAVRALDEQVRHAHALHGVDAAVRTPPRILYPS